MEVMILKILLKLRNKRGLGNLLAIVLVLCILLVASVVWEYMRLMIIAGGVRDAVQSSIISVGTTNYYEVYNGLREGYSGGYSLGGDHWEEAFSIGDIYQQLDTTLGLSRQGGRHIKNAGETMEYAVWGLDVSIINAPFAPVNPDTAGRFQVEATIELEVPLSLGWQFLPSMHVPLHLEAVYTPKF